MDVIQAARELGKAIQADDRYIRMMLNQQKSDEDTGLQQMIAAFTRKRTELNMAVSKSERDDDNIKALDSELKDMYQKIFENENMVEMNKTRGEMEEMMAFVNQIITGSTQGQNPETIEYEASCGGDCGGCSGCH